MANAGIILVNGGSLDCLNAMRVAWLPSLRIGLYKNDVHPQKIDNIGHYEPCDFPGYDGLHDMPGWGAAYLDGDLAVSDSQLRTWTHNGSPGGGWVVGYYVVNLAGALVWAERPQDGQVAMVYSGQVYQVTPQYAVGSRYPT